MVTQYYWYPGSNGSVIVHCFTVPGARARSRYAGRTSTIVTPRCYGGMCAARRRTDVRVVRIFVFSWSANATRRRRPPRRILSTTACIRTTTIRRDARVARTKERERKREKINNMHAGAARRGAVVVVIGPGSSNSRSSPVLHRRLSEILRSIPTTTFGVRTHAYTHTQSSRNSAAAGPRQRRQLDEDETTTTKERIYITRAITFIFVCYTCV